MASSDLVVGEWSSYARGQVAGSPPRRFEGNAHASIPLSSLVDARWQAERKASMSVRR